MKQNGQRSKRSRLDKIAMCVDLAVGLPATAFGIFLILTLLMDLGDVPHGGEMVFVGAVVCLIVGFAFLIVAHAMWNRLPGRWFALVLIILLPFGLLH